jgi:ERCC4-type nuclease
VTSDTDESADIESIDGIGPKTAEALAEAGIETVGDLRSIERSELYDIEGIGAATASQLLSLVDGDSADESDAEETTSDEDESDEDENEGDEETVADDTTADDTSDDGTSTGSVGLLDVRNTTVDMAPELIGRDLDGVIEVTKRGDEWVSVVEMIERKSVPDTQDILGRYEIEFDAGGNLTGYRRVNRYRRTESNPDEF